MEKGYRCPHVDEFTMQEDGTIGKIRQTLNGRRQRRFVDAYQENRAVTAAVMGGVDAVPADGESGYYGCGNMALGNIGTGDFVKVQGVDFGSASPRYIQMSVRNAEDAAGGNAVQLRMDAPDGEVLGYLSIDILTGRDFKKICAQLAGTAEGIHDLYLIFAGEGYEIETWQFLK